MNRYITFTKDSIEVIDSALVEMEALFPEADFSAVRFSHGLADYGSNYGLYNPKTHIIRLSLNESFSILKLTDEGLAPADRKQMRATVIHELAHHAELFAPAGAVGIGSSTHQRGSWLWAVCRYWNHALLKPEYIKFAANRSDRQFITNAVTHFSSEPVKPLVQLITSTLLKYKRTCEHCGEVFSYRRKNARFCSAKCRAAANRLSGNEAKLKVAL